MLVTRVCKTSFNNVLRIKQTCTYCNEPKDMELTKDKSKAAPSATARSEAKPVEPRKNASEDAPRTSGRNRKPRVVFDPSDNYIGTRSLLKENIIICSVCKDVRLRPRGLSFQVVHDNWKCKQCEANPEPIEEESSLKKEAEEQAASHIKPISPVANKPTKTAKGNNIKDEMLDEQDSATPSTSKTGKQIANCAKKESEEQAVSNIKPISLVVNKPTKTAEGNNIKDESAKIICKVLSSIALDEQDSPTPSTSRTGKEIANCAKTYSRLPKNQQKGTSSSETAPGNDSKPTEAKHELIKESYEVPKNNRYVVKDWTVDQVVKYVARHYPQDAHVFRDQYIDGSALLLLSRNDVLKGFGIKLGKALRLYELVSTLQNRSDDITLAWAN